MTTLVELIVQTLGRTYFDAEGRLGSVDLIGERRGAIVEATHVIEGQKVERDKDSIRAVCQLQRGIDGLSCSGCSDFI